MLLIVVTGLQATGKSTIAGIAGDHLGAPVLSHDWAMSGLRPYPEIHKTLDAMDPPGHGRVGWSILWALARAQLRGGRSVVLDGVARHPEIDGSRQLWIGRRLTVCILWLPPPMGTLTNPVSIPQTWLR